MQFSARDLTIASLNLHSLELRIFAGEESHCYSDIRELDRILEGEISVELIGEIIFIDTDREETLRRMLHIQGFEH